MRVNGFYGHIQRNRLRSLVMFGGFLLAMQIIAAVVLETPLFFLAMKSSLLWDPKAYFHAFGLPVAGASLILFAGNYFSHLNAVQELSGFRKVSIHDEPRLWRIVEMQAMLAGLPMPTVGVIPSRARNAFAAGLGQSSAVVVVTHGLLEALDDEQLEAVVAHEIAHISNGDIGAMAVANAMLSSLFMIANRNPLRLDKWYKLALCFIFFPLLFIYLIGGFVAYVGTTLGMFSRYIIASSREFIADAQAVQMTKNPAALISALQIIEGKSAITGLDPQLDAMMIDGETMGAYASHPPMHERIAILTQLAGGMAMSVGRRKDTRPEFARDTAPQPAPAFAGHSDIAQFRARFVEQSAAVPVARSEPPSSLVERLHIGSSTTPLGMTPSIQKTLKYLFIGALALMAANNILLRPLMKDNGGSFKVRTATTEVDNDPVSLRLKSMNITYDVNASGDWRLNPDKMLRMDPLAARCFDADLYRPGDRGFLPFRQPDPALVEKFYSNQVQSSEVVIERYLAAHLRSLDKVESATGGEALVKALNDYVRGRAALLKVGHRFFALEGLSAIQQAYTSKRDRTVIDLLRRQSAAGTKFGQTSREAQEIALLMQTPEDFVPCQARAELNSLELKP